MKRFTWIALLNAAVLVCATWTASARVRDNIHITLSPPADSLFPHAGGSITLALYRPPIWYWLNEVSVSKLAPNASYYMPLYVYDSYGRWAWINLPIKTDTRGNCMGSVGGRLIDVATGFEVYDSSGTLVLTSK
jgi:hypothetical protein